MNSLETIKEEYKNLISNPISNIACTIALFNFDNFYEWKITYVGPKDSLYKGGVFIIKLLFPKEYPNKAPEIIFLTPIYHLNVKPKKLETPSLGFASLNITNLWKSGTTAREVLTQIYPLFYCQNPDSPFGLDRAKEYLENRLLFEIKAKYFTRKYANPKNILQQFDDKDWDFSCSEKDLEPIKLREIQKEKEKEKEKENDKSKEDINLIITYNGKTTTTIQCGTDELMKNIIEKWMNKLGKSENLEKLLVIFLGKNIDLNSSVKDIRLRNNSNIDIILVDV